MRTNSRRSLTGMTLALGVALVAAACSGGTAAESDGATAATAATTADAPATDDGAPEVTDLTVGIVPVVDHASVFIAVQEGFFEEEGLTVEATPMQGGAAALPAMVSGDIQSAFASYPSFFLAEQQGLGVTIVAEGIRGTEETAGIYVAADSPIAEPKDLEGATVAVNTLNNIGDVSIKAALDEAGVDASSLQFVEMAFPDMPAALAMGNVDAVWVVEPFRSIVANDGARKVFASYTGIADDIPVSGLGMTDEFVAANPNTVAAFVRAIEKANALLAEDPDAAREIVQTYSEISPEAAAGLELPRWVEGPADTDELARWNELMIATGAFDTAVDMADLTLEAK